MSWMDLAKKSKKSCFSFKVDFEKDYDLVSWYFLDYMLYRSGFNDKSGDWICACVFLVIMRSWLTIA